MKSVPSVADKMALMLDMNRNLQQHVWSHFHSHCRPAVKVSVMSESLWAWWKRRRTSTNAFSLWGILHIFFYSPDYMFAYLNEPQHFIVFANLQYNCIFFLRRKRVCRLHRRNRACLCMCKECVVTPLQPVEVSHATFHPDWQTVQLTAHWRLGQLDKKIKTTCDWILETQVSTKRVTEVALQLFFLQ